MHALRIVGFLCAFAPLVLLAEQETLSFRLNSGGDLEAVVSGRTDYCGLQFVPPSSITRTGTDIAISSPDTEYLCGVPPPFAPYQVVANLGPLDSSSTYHVTWSEGPVRLTGQVSPGGLPAAPTTNYTALWWVPAESGWGININHQDSTIFAVLFSYYGDGTPMWLVAPNLNLLLDGSFSGDVYRVQDGAPFSAPWSPAKDVRAIGIMTARFATDHTGTVTVTYDGESAGQQAGPKTFTKTIEKEVFSTPTACSEGKGSRVALTNYQDMWWNPNEPGWGISITHQASIILAVLFTYDGSGRDTWFVGPDLTEQADGTFSGSLYSTRGPSLGTLPWGAITAAQVGAMTLQFTDGETGTLSYMVNGATVTKPIQREVTGAVRPRCQ